MQEIIDLFEPKHFVEIPMLYISVLSMTSVIYNITFKLVEKIQANFIYLGNKYIIDSILTD